MCLLGVDKNKFTFTFSSKNVDEYSQTLMLNMARMFFMTMLVTLCAVPWNSLPYSMSMQIIDYTVSVLDQVA